MATDTHLSRVSGSIGPAIREFFKQRLNLGMAQFNLHELYVFVADDRPVAPGSVDRIMRDLRSNRAIDYRVVSRAKSLYEIVPIKKQRDLWN